MHLVNQVHLEPASRRRILNIFQQFTGILDLGPTGGVNFDQVNKPAFVYFMTGSAAFTGPGGNAGFTVKALCENSGQGGFPYPAGSGEKVGVVQTLIIQRVDEGLEYVPLSGDFGKICGSPFAGENLIAHGLFMLFDKDYAAKVKKRLELESGNPRQPHPGTWISYYRCSLPGLAEFITYHCEGTDKSYQR